MLTKQTARDQIFTKGLKPTNSISNSGRNLLLCSCSGVNNWKFTATPYQIKQRNRKVKITKTQTFSVYLRFGVFMNAFGYKLSNPINHVFFSNDNIIFVINSTSFLQIILNHVVCYPNPPTGLPININWKVNLFKICIRLTKLNAMKNEKRRKVSFIK